MTIDTFAPSFLLQHAISLLFLLDGGSLVDPATCWDHAARGASRCVGRGRISDGASLRPHAVDALADVVDGLDGGTDGTTT